MGKKKNKPGKAANLRTQPPSNFIVNALVEENDRGCVLVGAAYLEFEMGRLLKAYFERNSDASSQFDKLTNKVLTGSAEGEPLLGSGWSRAAIATLLGLITPYVFDLFNQIRLLRNLCAHLPDAIAIDDEAVRGIKAALSATDKKSAEYWFGEESATHPGLCFGPKTKEFTEPRKWFMHAVLDVYGPVSRSLDEVLERPDHHRGRQLGSFSYDATPTSTN